MNNVQSALRDLEKHLQSNPDAWLIRSAAQKLVWHLQETIAPPAQVFELGPSACCIDGHSFAHHGRGLVVAWLVLALHQCRLDPLPVSIVAPNRRAALNSLSSAASRVEVVAPRVAAIIDRIGTKRGDFVAPIDAGAVVCSSPFLSKLSLGVTLA